jgi:hypothetical protein
MEPEVIEYFRHWFLYCWGEQDPDWIEHMGHMTFDEYVAQTTLPSWDAYPPS